MINIEDDILRLWRLGLLEGLLFDRTTRRNILWATDAHADLGEGYAARNEIRAELIIGDRSGVIKTRAKRAASVQSDRTRTHGEVFTPLRICRQMNDFADEALSSRISRTDASDRCGTLRYIDARVLEIACGEAPYLAGRYDVATGDEIPLDERVGIVDRKLRAADKLAADETEWLSLAFRAFEASYGYELAGDNLLIARVNMLCTFEDYLFRRLRRAPDAAEYQRLIKIITWNVWQMDGLSGATPDLLRLSRAPDEDARQGNLFADIDSFTENDRGASRCRVYDWRSRRSVEFLSLGYRGGNRMKFDFIIGNPPYQEENENNGRKPPIYHLFMDEAYKVGTAVELITPARFLFNAGQTPNAWNKKMLNDEHLKVLSYMPDAGQIFPNTDIKGGVAITYRDSNKNFGKIEVFVAFNELKNIMIKVSQSNTETGNMESIIASQGLYRFSPIFFEEYPQSAQIMGAGTGNKIVSSVIDKLPQVFINSPHGNDYAKFVGRVGNRRVDKYINRKYLCDNDFIDSYNVIVPESNNSGAFGETLSSPIIGAPNIGHADTFLSVGKFKTEFEAKSCLKYIKSKFARAMLGILKVTQHNPPATWQYVPLQDFTPSSDIDWSKSVAEIDRQLYAKYGLSDEEINFIESHVKEME